MYYILRTAKKKVRDLPSTHLWVVNCASAGTLPAEAESLRPLRGRLNKLERITENYGPLLFGVCIPYGTSATIVQQRTIHTDGFVSTKNPRKTSFTPASLGFCGAGPTETEPSHCSFLQTMHRGAPMPSNGLNLRF